MIPGIFRRVRERLRRAFDPLADLRDAFGRMEAACGKAIADARERDEKIDYLNHVIDQCEADRAAIARERDEARAEVAELRSRVARLAADERGHRLVCERAQATAERRRDRLAAIAEAAAAPID